MHKMAFFKNGAILAVVVIGICALLCGNAVAAEDSVEAFTGPRVKSKEISVFDVNALVEQVDPLNASMVIAEKSFTATQFMVDNKVFKTELTNESGNSVKIDAFQEGQRVFVRGFKYADDVYIALMIQIISSESVSKDYRSVDRMKPVDAQ